MLGHVGRRKAARIEGDGAIALPEIPQLRLEAAEVSGEFMHEDHGTARSRFLEIEANAVIGGRVSHRACPLQMLVRASYRTGPSKRKSGITAAKISANNGVRVCRRPAQGHVVSVVSWSSRACLRSTPQA